MNYKITIPPQTRVQYVRVIQTSKKAVVKSVSVNVYVGIKIMDLRKKKELSQIQLAKMMGLDRVSVINIEKGRQSLTMINLEKICKIFKVKSKDVIPF